MNMKNAFSVWILLFFSFFPACFANSLPRPPYDYRVCSSNNVFCAQATVSEGIRIFKISQGGAEYLLRTIPGWYPQVFLSNDGEKLVTVLTTIVPEYALDQPVVKIFIGDKLRKAF